MTWLGWLSVWLCGLVAGGLSGATAAYLLVAKRSVVTGAPFSDASLSVRPAPEATESLDPRSREQALLGLKRGENPEIVAASVGLSGPELVLLQKVNDLAASRR